MKDPTHHVARYTLNTLQVRYSGCVWTRFVSPFDYPICRILCTLEGGGRDWPQQKTSDEGGVFWDNLPLENYYIRMELAGRVLEPVVPWMREKFGVNYERLMDADELIGLDDDIHGFQVRLLGLGFDCGEVDGVIGPKTQAALRQFRQQQGLGEGMPVAEVYSVLADIFGA
jgi:hypothetical protein